MKLEIQGKYVAHAYFDIETIRQEMSDDGPFMAIQKSFRVISNEIYENEEEFFRIAYSEINWGIIFIIMYRFPERKKLEIKVFPIKFDGMPVLKKQIVDALNGKIGLKVDTINGNDYIIVGEEMLTEPDAWLDAFLGGRFFDPINSNWEKTIIDLRGEDGDNGGMEK